MTKLIMGVDASTSCTGWAFLDTDGKLIEYGKISPPAKLEYLQKCDFIVKGLISQLDLKKESIIDVGIEILNTSRNMKITRILAGLSQIIRYSIFTRYGITVK